MTINERIYRYAVDTAAAHEIKDVRIGLGYTAVMIENGRTGLAATPKTHLHQGCTVFTGMLPLIDKNAEQLLALVNSNDPIETAVGLATANALINTPNADLDTGDVLTKIQVTSSDRVAMVGHFAPLVKPIRDAGAELNIFEQIATPDRGMRPSSEIPQKLPGCTICLLTATSIINKSFDDLIGHTRNCREVILLGASTPLIPEIFADTPITGLSGVIVTRPEELLHIVSAGGGMRRFKGVIEKVNRPVTQGDSASLKNEI
ncbi:MAG: DUF364 domain-containing protein [Desulfobacterales bacterium]|nr:DUF364 domain-containing protein [Desulfobacterales bacterium]